MLVIVGHGPSIEGCGLGDFIDEHKVCRLRRANVNSDVGFRTDIVCSSQERYEQKDTEFWHIGNESNTCDGELRRRCTRVLKAYRPKWWKASTGLSACIIARDKGYTKLGLIGFDYTLHPETANHWKHDVQAEFQCLMNLGIEIEEL